MATSNSNSIIHISEKIFTPIIINNNINSSNSPNIPTKVTNSPNIPTNTANFITNTPTTNSNTTTTTTTNNNNNNDNNDDDASTKNTVTNNSDQSIISYIENVEKRIISLNYKYPAILLLHIIDTIQKFPSFELKLASIERNGEFVQIVKLTGKFKITPDTDPLNIHGIINIWFDKNYPHELPIVNLSNFNLPMTYFEPFINLENNTIIYTPFYAWSSHIQDPENLIELINNIRCVLRQVYQGWLLSAAKHNCPPPSVPFPSRLSLPYPIYPPTTSPHHPQRGPPIEQLRYPLQQNVPPMQPLNFNQPQNINHRPFPGYPNVNFPSPLMPQMHNNPGNIPPPISNERLPLLSPQPNFGIDHPRPSFPNEHVRTVSYNNENMPNMHTTPITPSKTNSNSIVTTNNMTSPYIPIPQTLISTTTSPINHFQQNVMYRAVNKNTFPSSPSVPISAKRLIRPSNQSP